MNEQIILDAEPKELVVVTQLPILEEQIIALSAEIQVKIDDALALECTEESKSIVKKVKADLNKDKKDDEAKRIEVKNKIMQPYTDFEELYKKHILNKLNAAEAELNGKIGAIELVQKSELETAAKEYFDEYVTAKNIDFLTFENTGIKVGISSNKTALKKQVKEFIDRVADDLALIDTQDNKVEILVEYKKNLNVSNAITTVSERHKAIEVEQAKVVEVEAVKEVEQKVIEKVEAVFSAPVVDEKEYTLNFSALGTKSNLKLLIDFAKGNGIKLTQLPKNESEEN